MALAIGVCLLAGSAMRLVTVRQDFLDLLEYDGHLMQSSVRIQMLDDSITSVVEHAIHGTEPELRSRYDELIAALDQELQKARQLAPDELDRFLANNDRANKRLIAAELRAWKALEEGNHKLAHANLDSAAYRTDKRLYRLAVQGLTERLSQARLRHIAEFERESRQAILAVCAALLLMAFTVYFFVRGLRLRIRAEQRIRELEADHRRELEQKVTERTADVSAGRRALEVALSAVEHERAVLDSVFELSPIGLVVLNSDLRIERYNQAIERLGGKPFEDWIGARVGEALGCTASNGHCSDVGECTHCALRAAVQSAAIDGVDRRTFEAPFRQLGPSGLRTLWLVCSARKITLNGTSRILVAITDVSEQKQAEEDLREREESFRLIFESCTDPVLLLRSNLFVACNDAAVKALGLSTKEEVLGRTPFELSPVRQPNGQTSAERGAEMIAIAEREGFVQFEWVHQTQAGDSVDVEVMITAMRLNGRDHLHVVWRDIAARKRAEADLNRRTEELEAANASLERMANCDDLTGLVNRRRFHELVEAELDTCGGRPFALLFLDLDNFKVVNDSLGHEAGDDLLRQVGQRMLLGDGLQTQVARLGGDEFALLLGTPTSPMVAEAAAERIVRRMESPFELKGHSLTMTCSIGVVTSEDAQTVEELLQRADTAMYVAKRTGKSGYRVFEPAMLAEVQARLDLEAELRRAWDERSFEIHFQPLVDVLTGAPCEVEALLRWNHAVRGWIPPSEFVPLAEEINLIGAIGPWVLEEACVQANAWRQSWPNAANLRIAVNVSGRQLERRDFLSQIKRALEVSELPPHALTLEVTETTVMTDLEAVTAKLRALRELGVRIAIDDFGTGYSSMGVLATLPADTVKIDRSFVGLLGENLEATAIMRALTTLCRVLGTRCGCRGDRDRGPTRPSPSARLQPCPRLALCEGDEHRGPSGLAGFWAADPPQRVAGKAAGYVRTPSWQNLTMTTIAFPAYAAQRATILGWTAVLSLAFAGICCAVGFWVPGAWWAFLPATFGPTIVSRAVISWCRMKFGDRGEVRVVEALEALDDRCIVVRNWVPDKQGGDIDVLLLTPSGVWVLEVITYAVPTKAEGHRWWVQREDRSWRPIKSPSRQLTRNVGRVNRALGVKAKGLLVFNDRADLRVANVPVPVIRRRELADVVVAEPEHLPDARLAEWAEMIRHSAA